MKVFLTLKLFLLIFSCQAIAQTSSTEISFGQSQSNLFTLCNGHLYSNNGTAEGYPSNYDATIALDGITAQDAAMITFEMVQLGAGDNIYVYDALNSNVANNSNLLATISGNPNLPITVKSKSMNGRLLVRFKTDNISSSSEIGFRAAISCTTRVQAIDFSTNLYQPLENNAYGNGATFNTSAQVINRGNISAPATTLRLLLSQDTLISNEDILLGSSAVNGLNKYSTSYGINIPVKIPTTLASGRYYLIYEADGLHEVKEFDEGNNTFAQAIQIYPPVYDLAITNLSTSPKLNNIPIGSKTECTISFCNYGNGNTKQVVLMGYLSQDSRLSNEDIPLFNTFKDSLVAYQKSSKNVSFTIPSGTPEGYNYILITGTLPNLTETSTSNNKQAFSTHILPIYYDFQITNFNDQPSITRGSSLRQNGDIHNKGNATAYHVGITYLLSTDTIADAGDRFLKTITIDSIRAESHTYFNKASDSVLISSENKSGKYYLLGIADYENSFAESNEINNKVFYKTILTDTLYFPIQPKYSYGTFSNNYVSCDGDLYYDGKSIFTAALMGTIRLQAISVNQKVQLLFDTFDMRISDTLWVYDDDQKYTFTKNSAPSQVIISSGNFLCVKCKVESDQTNYMVTTNGFHARYSCQEATTTEVDEANEVQDFKLKISPNPSEGTVVIDFQESSLLLTDYRVVNLFGQTIATGKHNFGKSLSLDLSALHKGLYFCQVNDPSGTIFSAPLLLK